MLIALFLGSFIQFGFSQTFQPLECSGDLNKDFTNKAKTRFENKKTKKGSTSRRERKDRDQFALETAVELNRRHRSGYILTGDWVSELVTRVGKKVAAAAPKTKEEVRFYVLSSSGVNAFATSDHTVYVTMGLLARLESEAQLAFILAHELGHVHHNHVIDIFLEKANNERKSDRIFKRDKDPFSINRYSQAKEEEADDYGFDIFAKMDYSGADAVSVFELLSKSYLPFEEHHLTASDIIPSGMEVDTSWFNHVVFEREADEIDEEESTHPATEDRMAEASSRVGSKMGKQFVTWTPEELKKLRRQARYEVTDYALRDFNNYRAIHNALWLLNNDENPDTTFLNRTLVQAGLNRLSVRYAYEEYVSKLRKLKKEKSTKYAAERALKDLDPWPDAKDAWGEMQMIYHLFDEAELEDLYETWTNLAINLEIENPSLPSAKALTDISIEGYLRSTRRSSYKTWSENNAQLTALAKELDLEKRFRTAKKFVDLDKYNQEDATRLNKLSRKDAALNTRKVLVLAPRYRHGKIRFTGMTEDPLKTEVGEPLQVDLIKQCMKANNIKGEVVTDQLEGKSADQLNDLRIGRSWIQQYLSLESARLIPHNHDRMLALLDERKISKIVYLSENESKVAGIAQGYRIYADIFYVLISPVDGLASMVSPRTTRDQLHLVINPLDRKIEYSERIQFYGRQGKVRKKAIYYDFFHQIAQKPKR